MPGADVAADIAGVVDQEPVGLHVPHRARAGVPFLARHRQFVGPGRTVIVAAPGRAPSRRIEIRVLPERRAVLEQPAGVSLHLGWLAARLRQDVVARDLAFEFPEVRDVGRIDADRGVAGRAVLVAPRRIERGGQVSEPEAVDHGHVVLAGDRDEARQPPLLADGLARGKDIVVAGGGDRGLDRGDQRLAPQRMQGAARDLGQEHPRHQAAAQGMAGGDHARGRAAVGELVGDLLQRVIQAAGASLPGDDIGGQRAVADVDVVGERIGGALATPSDVDAQHDRRVVVAVQLVQAAHMLGEAGHEVIELVGIVGEAIGLRRDRWRPGVVMPAVGIGEHEDGPLRILQQLDAVEDRLQLGRVEQQALLVDLEIALVEGDGVRGRGLSLWRPVGIEGTPAIRADLHRHGRDLGRAMPVDRRERPVIDLVRHALRADAVQRVPTCRRHADADGQDHGADRLQMVHLSPATRFLS